MLQSPGGWLRLEDPIHPWFTHMVLAAGESPHFLSSGTACAASCHDVWLPPEQET